MTRVNIDALRNLVLVGAGGFLGSIARYLLGGAVMHATGAPRFPAATLAVNTLGCLTIGLLGGLAEHRHVFTPATRLFLFTGILGGFTTYSAFAFESVFLLREQLTGSALLNVLLHVGLGLGGVWLGLAAARLCFPAGG